ncbi:M20 family metallopeptidase [Hoeflea sp.]|uniref:M20 family metallopeptidase n=1 Tax=Hoeflea sp. TaxID=1940281 RepID=UPI003B01FE04
MTANAPGVEEFRQLVDREETVSLLRAAISQESVTGNEANFVDFLERRMADLGLAPQRADFLPGRPNVWGERGGTGGGDRLLFIGHTDTVHVRGWKERWQGTEREDPFAAPEIDGEIWGRGSGDLKAGICAALSAVELLDKAGVTLKGDIAFAFVGDEESGEPGTGVSAGIKDYTQRVLSGAIGKPDFAIYVEPTRLAVFPAQMGFFIADIRINGKSAYFGVPELGVDALKAAHTVSAAIWEHSDAISARDSHPLVGRAFALVTEMSGGGYIAVPGEARLSLIRKLLPGERLDDAVAEFEEAVNGAAVSDGISIGISYPAGRDHQFGGSPSEVAEDLPQIQNLAEVLGKSMPGRGQIEGAPYWSEIPFLNDQIGCPAVYCAPGDITNCHTLEERVNIEEYVAGAVAFAAFIVNQCGVANR